MKRLAALFVGFFAGAMTLVCSTQGQKYASPLMEPYTPTRLEWLALDLESRFKSQLSGDAGIVSTDFTANAPDTVVVSVMYTTDASAAVVDAVIEHAKDFVKMDAESYGWSKWIKIRAQRKHIPSSGK